MHGKLKPPCRLLLWAFGLTLVAAPTKAQPSSAPAWLGDVSVELPDCEHPPFEAAELLERLTLELDQRGLRLAAPSATKTAALSLRLDLPQCDPDTEVLLFQIAKPSTQQTQRRALALSELPLRLRPRILGLVLAESVSLLAISPEPTPPEPAPQPPGRAAQPPERAALSPERDQVPVVAPAPVPVAAPGARIGGALQLRSALRRPRAFWGAELQLLGPMSGSPSWAVEAAYATSSMPTALGALHAHFWSAAAGVDWTLRRVVNLSVGPRLSVAYVSTTADPRPGIASAHPSATLALFGGRARAELPLGAAWSLRGALDLQRPVRGLVLTASKQPTLTLDAWILAPSLGVSYQM